MNNRLPNVLRLTAMTAAPFCAELRPNGSPGFFEPLFGYERRIRIRACACDAMVERIEDAVAAIVGREQPATILRTQRVALPVPAVLSH